MINGKSKMNKVPNFSTAYNQYYINGKNYVLLIINIKFVSYIFFRACFSSSDIGGRPFFLDSPSAGFSLASFFSLFFLSFASFLSPSLLVLRKAGIFLDLVSWSLGGSPRNMSEYFVFAKSYLLAVLSCRLNKMSFLSEN